MTAAHLHLMLNHFPVVGMIFSLIILFAAWRSSEETIKRIAIGTVVLTGLLTIPAFLTGEPAEEIIERLHGVSKVVIESHEEAAEVAAWAVWGAALIAAVGLVLSFKRKATPSWVIPILLVVSIGTLGVVSWANNLGGKISHPELRK